MTIVAAFIIVVVGAFIYWWSQGVNALGKFKAGAYGLFTVSRVSAAGESYLALDSERKQLALVNNPVPEFSSDGRLLQFRNMTVVFPMSAIKSVLILNQSVTQTVYFRFYEAVPEWNIYKELTFISGEEIRAFFERFIPELTVL